MSEGLRHAVVVADARPGVYAGQVFDVVERAQGAFGEGAFAPVQEVLFELVGGGEQVAVVPVVGAEGFSKGGEAG